MDDSTAENPFYREHVSFDKFLRLFGFQNFSKIRCMEVEQHVSPQALLEFKTIYRRQFGEDISDEAAQEMAYRLLSLFDILLGYGRKVSETS